MATKKKAAKKPPAPRKRGRPPEEDPRAFRIVSMVREDTDKAVRKEATARKQSISTVSAEVLEAFSGVLGTRTYKRLRKQADDSGVPLATVIAKALNEHARAA